MLVLLWLQQHFLQEKTQAEIISYYYNIWKIRCGQLVLLMGSCLHPWSKLSLQPPKHCPHCTHVLAFTKSCLVSCLVNCRHCLTVFWPTLHCLPLPTHTPHAVSFRAACGSSFLNKHNASIHAHSVHHHPPHSQPTVASLFPAAFMLWFTTLLSLCVCCSFVLE